MRARIKNLVKESHKKLAKFLCESYNLILLPHLPSQKLSRRVARRINSKTVRQMMMTWEVSHEKFRTILYNKAEEYLWVKVLEVSEAYSTITCGLCDELNNQVGGGEEFHCGRCGFHWGR
jgi:putative transposase